jgi:choline dehydrogenase-like flavoprotein
MPSRQFDFILCGGGSAASVVANRLVLEFGFSVLMLERGPKNTNGIMAMPAGYMKYLAKDTFLEMHHTVPQPQLGGRGPIVPQARALGGGSAVNAMVYMRGQKDDYDGWAAGLGNGSEWSYADVLPHFKALESNARFNDAYHGIGGPLGYQSPGISATRPRISFAQRRGWACPITPISTGHGKMVWASCSTPMPSGASASAARTRRRRFSIPSRATAA